MLLQLLLTCADCMVNRLGLRVVAVSYAGRVTALVVIVQR